MEGMDALGAVSATNIFFTEKKCFQKRAKTPFSGATGGDEVDTLEARKQVSPMSGVCRGGQYDGAPPAYQGRPSAPAQYVPASTITCYASSDQRK